MMYKLQDFKIRGDVPLAAQMSALSDLSSKVLMTVITAEQRFVAQLYRALPHEYAVTVESLKTAKSNRLDAISRLMQKESELRLEATVKSTNEAALAAKAKPKSDKQPRKRCEVCKRPGHTEAKCWVAHPELRPANLAPRPERANVARELVMVCAAKVPRGHASLMQCQKWIESLILRPMSRLT